MTTPLVRYFQVLACVARADAKLAPQERALVRGSAEAMGLDGTALASIDHIADPAAAVYAKAVLADAVRDMDASALCEVLRDAYVLAGADGNVDVTEISVIDDAMAARGIAERYRAPLHEWARSAAEQHIDGVRLVAEATSRG